MDLRDYAYRIGYGSFFDVLWEREMWLLKKAAQTDWPTEKAAALKLAEREQKRQARFVFGMAIRELFKPTGKPKPIMKRRKP